VNTHVRERIEAAEAYLTQHPDHALLKDTAATATLTDGLAVAVHGPQGLAVSTDMPAALGGGGTKPSPGWLLRAAQASCLATSIAMRAAHEGIALAGIEVVVDSQSDARGILGLPGVEHAGPLSSRARVRIARCDAPIARLQALVEWADMHSAVQDAVRRPVPCRLEIDVETDDDSSGATPGSTAASAR
jgi:organic hydroperoxide reductase OsmC/OhrA